MRDDDDIEEEEDDVKMEAEFEGHEVMDVAHGPHAAAYRALHQQGNIIASQHVFLRQQQAQIERTQLNQVRIQANSANIAMHAARVQEQTRRMEQKMEEMKRKLCDVPGRRDEGTGGPGGASGSGSMATR
jgi:hypothetical protein